MKITRKVVCGRTDCEYESKGNCLLNTIAIGKDCRCQNYKCCCNVHEVKQFQESVNNQRQEESNKNAIFNEESEN